MSRFLLSIALCATVCGALLSGCAFTDRHVNLAPIQTLPQSAVSSVASGNHQVISVAHPQDLRSDPTTVGNVRNGYGTVTAQVRPNNDVPLWVANSLIASLEEAGYRVERVETLEAARTPVAIDLGVSKVFADYTQRFFTINGQGEVAAQVEVYKQGRRVLRRTYTGKYENANLMVSTSASGYQGLLNEAVKDFLSKAVPELTSALRE